MLMKRIVSVILLAAILFTGTVTQAAFVYAESELESDISLESKPVSYDDLKKSMDIINNAIKNSPSIFGGEEAEGFVKVFENIADIAMTASKVFSAISGTMSFLKLIGVLEDKTQTGILNILVKLEEISEKIKEMDEKLNVITQEMAKIEASLEFNARSQKAISMLSNWNSFSYRYMEEGLDKLMTQFQAMQREGLKDWCENSGDSRSQGKLDNTKLILAYTESDGEWQLQYSMVNEVPDEYKSEGNRYIILPAEVLPDKIGWDINTYRDDLKKAIKEGILELTSSDSYTGEEFDRYGFDEFNPENLDALTEEFVGDLASDAADILASRIGYNKVNENAEFPLEVKRQFQNYTAHLLGAEDGIDALLKTYYLTHAFEGEIKNDLVDLCNQMIVKTGVYGTFATNILGMSSDIQEDEAESCLSYYCQAIEGLETVKENCHTGHDNYCYLTNNLVVFPYMDFTTKATIHTEYDNGSDEFMWHSAGPATVSFRGDYSEADMIGDAKALLILYTLQSNGKVLNEDFIWDVLGIRYYTAVGNYAVTSFTRDTDLSVNSGYTMRVRKIIGDWFTDNQNISMNARPGSATSDYYVHHRMAKGSVLDVSNGAFKPETMLSALAIYGESHWYWWDDEAAFLGAPAALGGFSSTLEKITTKTGGAFEYNNNYSQNVSYHAIMTEPYKLLSSGEGVLGSYVNLSAELTKEAIIADHEWNDGEVTLEPTCEESGLMTYTALDDETLKYTEVIEPLGHDWGEGVITKKPQCVDEDAQLEGDAKDVNGVRTYTCSHNPEHIYTECIPADLHDWGAWEVTKEPTATEPGERKRVCKVDSTHVETEEISAKDENITYDCTQGDNSTWTKGSSEGLAFTFERSSEDEKTFSHFTGIKVDGKSVTAENYTASEGSVIITLKPSYLETLKSGEHTIAASFDDGSDAAATFTIKETRASDKPKEETKKSDSSPRTSDEANPAMWLMIIGIAGGLLVFLRKRLKA